MADGYRSVIDYVGRSNVVLEMTPHYLTFVWDEMMR